jgi:hypothetical protein
MVLDGASRCRNKNKVVLAARKTAPRCLAGRRRPELTGVSAPTTIDVLGVKKLSCKSPACCGTDTPRLFFPMSDLPPSDPNDREIFHLEKSLMFGLSSAQSRQRPVSLINEASTYKVKRNISALTLETSRTHRYLRVVENLTVPLEMARPRPTWANPRRSAGMRFIVPRENGDFQENLVQLISAST